MGSKMDGVMIRFLMEPENSGPPMVFLIEMMLEAFRFRPYFFGSFASCGSRSTIFAGESTIVFRCVKTWRIIPLI